MPYLSGRSSRYSLPICKAWVRYLPNVTFFGISLSARPLFCRICIHLGCQILVIRSSLASVRFYLPLLSNRSMGQWPLIMSTQLIDHSISGICKRIPVAPPPTFPPARYSIPCTHRRQWIFGAARFVVYLSVGYFLGSQLSFFLPVPFLFSSSTSYLTLLTAPFLFSSSTSYLTLLTA